MSLLPWQSFRLESDRDTKDVIRELSDSIPSCPHEGFEGAEERSYFCGSVDVINGTFVFYRNVGRTLYRGGQFMNRHLAPVLHATLKPGALGTMIEVSIVPGVGFWIGVLLLSAAALPIPVGLLLWVLQAPMEGHPFFFCFFGVIAVISTSWLWGPALLAHYLRTPRYREELMRLVSRVK